MTWECLPNCIHLLSLQFRIYSKQELSGHSEQRFCCEKDWMTLTPCNLEQFTHPPWVWGWPLHMVIIDTSKVMDVTATCKLNSCDVHKCMRCVKSSLNKSIKIVPWGFLVSDFILLARRSQQTKCQVAVIPGCKSNFAFSCLSHSGKDGNLPDLLSQL